MKAAIVNGPNQTPIYGTFEDPHDQPGMERITVSAAALSPVVKARASGSHYSTGGIFPTVVGVDGVGRTAGGQRVYFSLPAAPFGAMAEQAVVPTTHCVALPDDVSDVMAAALANPGMSSVAALQSRASFKPGDTVLINGATGTAGQLAVQLARHMGAKKVIATGRDAAALQHLKRLGADVTVSLLLAPTDLETALGEQLGGGVDIVLDYIFGHSAETLLAAAAHAAPGNRALRYVVIGGSSGEAITLPAPILRALPLTIMGSGIGSVPVEDLMRAVHDVLHAAGPAQLAIDILPVPLSEVGTLWNKNSGRPRIVFEIP